ncbi:hypothetical protein J2847_005286 [Azospirillum agricola]|uniref:hypothetical protein n=1 Tax=Azospirillum agricola TaxID=1720247 RepID=UPI001AE7B55B|nr:hypothetical protein [Azospirillum agricola]MBP2231963.1 hypothetical protein [Azospirillum agricola]
MAKSKGTAVETLRVVAEATGEAPAPGTKPDPRLVDLVRLLARQAAREFVRSTGEDQAGDCPPS